MSLENNPQEKTTSFQFNNYLKAGAVSMLTLGAYVLARATNFLPHWRTQSGVTFTEVSQKSEFGSIQQLHNVAVSDLDTTSAGSKSAEELSVVTDDIHSTGLAEFKEIALELSQTVSIEPQKPETTSQRKLLSQGIVLKPIPDQVINANELYDFSIDVKEIFGPEMQVLTIMGNFPGWMGTDYYPLLKNYPFPGTINAVTVSETKAYVASGASGVYILDVTNPSAPILLGNYDTPGVAQKVQVLGSIAYVADSGSLQILNISNPMKPTYLANYSYLGAVKDIALDGNFAYVIDGSFLQRIDISNPLTPTVMGSGLIPSLGTEVLMHQGIAYVSAMTGIYTYANPPALPLPTLIGQYNMSTATSVVVIDKIAYVGGRFGSLYLINVSNPQIPILLGNYSATSSIVSLQIINGIAYAVEYSKSFLLINVTNVLQPTLLSRYVGSYAMCATVVGMTAYVASYALEIINIENPIAPFSLGSWTTGSATVYSIQVIDNVAYLASCCYSAQGSSIFAVNVANPASPFLLNTLQLQDIIYSIWIAGDIMYLAGEDFDSMNGLHIFDITNPAVPYALGVFQTTDNAYVVTVVGTIAYLTTSTSLLILNVLNPAKPILLHSYVLGSSSNDVTVVDNIAYVATNVGLKIINIADPQNLPLSAYATESPVFHINILNDTAMLVLGDAELQKLSIQNPNGPAWISSTTTLDAAQDIKQLGVLTYVAEGRSGIQVFNTINNQSLLMSAYPAKSITIVKDIAYLATGTASLYILGLAQGRLQGMPTLLNVGDCYTFTVTATDALGNWVTDSFQITVARFPVVFHAITPPNVFWANKPISFTLPSDTFIDLNNDPLTYSAVLTNQSPLPAWLVFSANNLTFSGTTINVVFPTTFTIQITAVNSLGGHVSATFPLVIQPNVPPTLTNQISDQFARVGTGFKFVIPQDTFIDAEGDSLTYRARLSDGSAFPEWLYFDGNSFSGTPGRTDTGFYSTRVLPILLMADDGKFSTSTTFNINVTGTSAGELFIKIALPLVSVASAAVGFYKKRAVFLNYMNKKKYQRLEAPPIAIVGTPFSHKLDTTIEAGDVVEAKLLKPISYCPSFFKNRNTKAPLPGGSLPLWLSYDAYTNSLVSKEGPPSTKWESFVIQVKNKDGVIKEEFTLKVVDSANVLDTQPVVIGNDVPLEVLPKEPRKV